MASWLMKACCLISVRRAVDGALQFTVGIRFNIYSFTLNGSFSSVSMCKELKTRVLRLSAQQQGKNVYTLESVY